VVFTGASIARVFFITAATYGAMSPYGSYAPILKELSSGTWAQLSDSLPRSFLRRTNGTISSDAAVLKIF
jgi:hypothetical protein